MSCSFVQNMQPQTPKKIKLLLVSPTSHEFCYFDRILFKILKKSFSRNVGRNRIADMVHPNLISLQDIMQLY